jgi:hypothetical protein
MTNDDPNTAGQVVSPLSFSKWSLEVTLQSSGESPNCLAWFSELQKPCISIHLPRLLTILPQTEQVNQEISINRFGETASTNARIQDLFHSSPHYSPHCAMI